MPLGLTPLDSGWTLELRTEVAPVTGSIPDVTLIAYTEQGAVACERTVGQVEGGDFTLACTAFPAIISARSELDCEDVIIDILYWTGTDEQQERPIPVESEIPYQTTERECDESLPPERLLNETATQ